VAGLTLRRKSVKDSGGCAFVAILALNGGVRTHQREAVLVVLHLLRSDRPSLNGVALFAVRSHLPAVDVCLLVAVRAILANILEYWFYVASDALHFFVHSTERIIGFVMIEFGYRADGSPTSCGVTVLTGDC